MALRAHIEIEGGKAEVAEQLRLIGDAPAGKLVEKQEPPDGLIRDCEDIEQIARVRGELAGKILDLDQTRINLGDAKTQLAIAEETIATLRSRVEGLEGQLEVDAQLIKGLREKLKDSSTAGSFAGSSPRPVLGSAVDEVVGKGCAGSPGEEIDATCPVRPTEQVAGLWFCSACAKREREVIAEEDVPAPPPCDAEAGVGEVVSSEKQLSGKGFRTGISDSGRVDNPGEHEAKASREAEDASSTRADQRARELVGLPTPPAKSEKIEFPSLSCIACDAPANASGMCAYHFVKGFSEETVKKLRAKKAAR